MSKLIAISIEWDKDENDKVELPKSIEIPRGMMDEDVISDYLSEQTGYCHKGFALVSI